MRTNVCTEAAAPAIRAKGCKRDRGEIGSDEAHQAHVGAHQQHELPQRLRRAEGDKRPAGS